MLLRRALGSCAAVRRQATVATSARLERQNFWIRQPPPPPPPKPRSKSMHQTSVRSRASRCCAGYPVPRRCKDLHEKLPIQLLDFWGRRPHTVRQHHDPATDAGSASHAVRCVHGGGTSTDRLHGTSSRSAATTPLSSRGWPTPPSHVVCRRASKILQTTRIAAPHVWSGGWQAAVAIVSGLSASREYCRVSWPTTKAPPLTLAEV